MIRNIWAVGRNYGEHAKELGNSVPDTPLVFLKAGSSAVSGEVFSLPSHSDDVHHELEIGLRFGPDLKFDGACLALDLTARDLQLKLKAAGQPWTLAKSFKESCPLSLVVPIPPEIPDFDLELTVNGAVRQKCNTAEMVFRPEVLRCFLIERFPVCPGDILLTGTPAGVARLNRGDRLSAWARSSAGHEIRALWSVR